MHPAPHPSPELRGQMPPRPAQQAHPPSRGSATLNPRTRFLRALLLLVLTCLLTLSSQAQNPPLISLAEILRLPPPGPAGPSPSYPVQIIVTVNGYDPGERRLFVVEGGAVLLLNPGDSLWPISAGDQVEITGTAQASAYGPIVTPQHIRWLATDHLPSPAAIAGTELTSGRFHARRVITRAIVLRGTTAPDGTHRLECSTGTSRFITRVLASGPLEVLHLLQSEIEIQGVLANEGGFGLGPKPFSLLATHTAHIRITRAFQDRLTDTPLTPIAELPVESEVRAADRPVRVRGVVTHLRPGRSFTLEQAGHAILCTTRDPSAPLPGNEVEILGDLVWENGLRRIADAVIGATTAAIEPSPATPPPRTLQENSWDGRLVRVEGDLLHRVSFDTTPTFVLADGDFTFEARLYDESPLHDLHAIKPGSRVQLTGIVSLDPSKPAPRPVRIYLRNAGDMAMVRAQPLSHTEGRRVSALLLTLLTAASAGLLICNARLRNANEQLNTAEARMSARHRELEQRIKDRTTALEYSEAELRSMMEGSPDLMLCIHPNNEIAFLNARFQRLLPNASHASPTHLTALGLPQEAIAAIRRGAEAARTGSGATQFTMDLVVGGAAQHFDMRAVRLSPGEEKGGRVLIVGRDITINRESIVQLARTRAMLEAITRTQAAYIASADKAAVFDGMLAAVLSLTGSDYGFVGEVLENADGKPYLRTHAISDIAWDAPSRRLYDSRKIKAMEFHRLDTLFGQVLATGQPVIANRPDEDPRRGGLPPGHPALHAFLGLPVRQAGRLIGMIGLANRPGGYDEAIVAWLEPFLQTYGSLIEVHRESQLRLQAERGLRESEERLRQFAEQVPQIVFLASVPDQRLLYVNSALERLTGLPRKELLACQDLWSRHLSKEDQQRLRHRMSAAIDSPVIEEFGFTPTSGARLWLRLHLFPIKDSTGTVYLRAGMAEDITMRRQSEAQLRELTTRLEQRVAERTAEIEERIRDGELLNHGMANLLEDLQLAKDSAERSARDLALANAQLQAANKELESFSYSVSHDLRAPLRHIDGFSQALVEDCSQGLSPEGQSYLDRIRAATRHMGLLIDDILRLSRVTRAEIVFEPLDISTMAEELAADLNRNAGPRTVEWVIQPHLQARGDRRLIRIVLENLLGNAWKYSRRQEKARIEVGSMQTEHGFAFFIRDNGAGFDMTYAGKLFGAFQRLHPATEFEGTGIGLATVQRVIHRHGGHVWAEAAVDKGACFWFTLPVASAQASDLSEAGLDI